MSLFSIQMPEYSKEVKIRYIKPFSYILMIMAFFNSYIYYSLYHSNSLALICAFCGLAATAVPFMKRSHISHQFLANYVIILFFIAVSFVAIFSGGINSNAIWWLGTIPLLASFLLNAFYGVIWFAIIMGNFLYILILERHDLLPVNVLMEAEPIGRMIVSFSLNSTLIFILCVLTELIRDRAFMEKEELRFKSFQLNQMASLGKLAAGVAHEINNPLTVIRGFELRIARMIEDGTEINKEILIEYMAKIQKNVQRIQEVTGLMRTVSEKAIDRTISEIHLQALINDVIQMFSEQIKNENIKFILKFPSKAIFFQGIYMEIFQAFFNIIENAIYELEEVEKGQAKEITISFNQTEKEIVVLIQDTGRGVPTYIRDHIFDPFFTTKSMGHGKGLGLSFSFNVFTSMGGSLDLLDSEIGSLFKVSLPLKTL
ncbi:MAG: HAMP domain-containing sensor histidine kinase [Bacteriovorax sp.]|jgi:signal transduction histidine kinase